MSEPGTDVTERSAAPPKVAIAPDDVRTALEEVLSSPAFGQSESLKRFLRYVVEAKLAGRAAGLKELTLGTEVFDRGEQYDPRIDPIVRVQATRLRAKLREYYQDAGATPIVFDIPKGTYVPEVRRGDEIAAGAPDRSMSPSTSLGKLVVVLALLAAGLLLVWTVARDDAVAPSDVGEVRSLVVLPFTDMSPEPDQAFYGDALADEITTTLARLPDLRLVPRTTAFAYRDVELSTIEERLAVDAVLQGSVRRLGDALRVSAQLIAKDGRQIWAATYDEEEDDAFEVQERIAFAVVDAVERELLPEREEAPPPEAYELYLRGRFLFLKSTPESIERAIAAYERATEEDPTLAPAYAGLVEALVMQVLWGASSPAQTKDQAREASERALALEGGIHAEALAAAALYALFYEWDFELAHEIVERAEELEVASDEIGVVTGLLALAESELDVAIKDFAKAATLSPSVPLPHFLGALVAHYIGRDADALTELAALREWAPEFALAHLLEARILASGGDFDVAAASLDAFDRIAGETPVGLAARGALHAQAGEQDEARAALTSLQEIAQQRYVSRSARARVLANLGEVDAAFEELAAAVADRSFPIIMAESDPDFAAVRADYRYQTLRTTVWEQ